MIKSMSFYCKTLKLIRLELRSDSKLATFSLRPYNFYKLESGPEAETVCTKEDGLNLLKQMKQIRVMEKACETLFAEDLIHGFCHLSTGQEAVAVGVEAALKPVDSVIGAYRCYGFTMTRGASIRSILGELIGKKTGVCKGKGGSVHMFTKQFFGGHGIIGAQVPIGTGIALSHKYKKDNGICIILYGDGAANQGQVFEAFNIAKLWNLPCIFVCENNHYAMKTNSTKSSSNVHYYTRGDYIPGLWIDGMHVLTVREATRFATNWCRSGNGPIIIEAETYRYMGHSMKDPGTEYRTNDEIQAIRKEKDPIKLFSQELQNAGFINEALIKQMDKEIKEEVDAAMKECKEDNDPELIDAYTHVFKKSGYIIRGCDNMSWTHPPVTET